MRILSEGCSAAYARLTIRRPLWECRLYWFDANIAGAHLAVDQLSDAMATAQVAIGEMPLDTWRVGELP